MIQPQISGREAIADWIESTLLIEGVTARSLAQLEAEANEQFHVSAQDVQLALSSLEQRNTILGSAYPFEVTPVAVKASADALERPYSLLVLLTSGGLVRRRLGGDVDAEMARAFESITCGAIEALLGPRSIAIRFGWPSEIGRPPEFPQAVAWLAEKMGIQPGRAYRPPRRRDGGVDVVGWRPFPDGRSGFPVVLVQCTLQQDIVAKARDVDVRVWAGWLTLDSDPLTVLAIPGTIPASEQWNEIAVQCLILERLRIAGLLEERSLADFDGATDLIHRLVEKTRESQRAAR